MSPTPVAERVERLSRASVRRSIEPDIDIIGSVGDGQVIPDELLSVAGLDLNLTSQQKAALSREEVASMLDAGVRFEAILEAGFALQIAGMNDLTDPRLTYLCHEIGEETRHQRAFQRVIRDLAPKASNPLAASWWLQRLDRQMSGWLIRHHAALYVMVLAGEEIPDLLQKLASEHPDTDPFLAEVNRYHRQEEARHLSFARAMLPELWEKAGRFERMIIRYVLPIGIRQMFEFMVHPGVYEVVGLNGWDTWKAANATTQRQAIRHEATRPVLAALIDAGVLSERQIPKAWNELVGQ